MAICTVSEQPFYPGKAFSLESASHAGRFQVVFEDDGETGYFYALDSSMKTDAICDAVHIYNAKSIRDNHIVSTAKIGWSRDGKKAVLLINNHPHAIFDFDAKQGYCRTNFPPPADGSDWSKAGHAWNDHAQQLFA